MARKGIEGGQTLEVSERELYELRQGIKHREHELELAHNYLAGKGLATEAADERLRILRGSGPDAPGLMHRLGFVDSEIGDPPEAGADRSQLSISEGGGSDG